jgi:hypothetical protein
MPIGRGACGKRRESSLYESSSLNYGKGEHVTIMRPPVVKR